jgi:hypothetical protein
MTPMTMMRKTKQCKLALLCIKVKSKFLLSNMCKTWDPNPDRHQHDGASSTGSSVTHSSVCR